MRSTVTVQSALVVRQLRIALDFDEDTVAHMQQRAASAVAIAANALEDDCDPSRCRHLLPDFAGSSEVVLCHLALRRC
jgi:hypothetical protein